MRIDATLVFTRDDQEKMIKEGRTLYLPKELLRMLDNDSPLPIPIVFERLRKRRGDIIEGDEPPTKQKLLPAPNKEKPTLPCILGCGKLIRNEYGMYKHLLMNSKHKKDPTAKKWVADYHTRVKANRSK